MSFRIVMNIVLALCTAVALAKGMYVASRKDKKKKDKESELKQDDI